jgi:hypothetical protein
MNIYDLTNYVNLDVDDVYEVDDIAKWFNKGIANYNLIPPLTQYPIIDLTDASLEADYPLDDNFMLGIMLPFINNSIMAQDAALREKQLFFQEFMMNAREHKKIYPISNNYLVDNVNTDLDNYRIGQNVFVSDMRYSPMQGEWAQRSNYYTIEEEQDDEYAWTGIAGEDIDG